jgi:ribose transport system ATP-binding protein
VLRDGRVVGTVATRETTETRLVEMIIGRELPPLPAAHGDPRSREVQVAVESLSTAVLDGISLGLYEGEVLGLTGLAGSGFEDIPYVLFGAAGATSGRLALNGRAYELSTMSPEAALRAGIGLIPADRQRDGSIGSLRVVENMMLQVLDQYFNHFILRRREMVRGSAEAMITFDVRPNDPLTTYSSLSGGNQQKALLAKWLQTKPALLLLHEPTQGVDVGARQQIFRLIREAASAGTCVICASSDHEQLAAISDRVLIFGRGRIVRSLVGKEVSKDRISEQTLNSVALLENLTLTSG